MPAPAGSTGELTTALQVAIGNAFTAGQAAELLPLWQTLQVLYSSDTAAALEIDALTSQIQDTMTAEQMQAITACTWAARTCSPSCSPRERAWAMHRAEPTKWRHPLR